MIQRVDFPGGEAAPCFSPPACLEWDSQLHWPSEVQESWEEKGKLDCLSLTLSMVLNHWLELRRGWATDPLLVSHTVHQGQCVVTRPLKR